MLIAQITDIHLGFDLGNPVEHNRKRLDRVLQELCEGPNRPDLLLATGDLTERGDVESYGRLAEALSSCGFPVLMSLGNHDVRSNFITQFPHVPVVDGFVQYVTEMQGLRLIVLDTLEQGRHGGAFCETRAAWLRQMLADDVSTPTIIVMHHPPVEVGIDWMNTDPDELWVQNFARAIENAPNIKSIICGHIHRSVVVPWQGTAVAICASTAPQVSLDLRLIDPEMPDDRSMIVAEPPAYALHYWNGRELVTYFKNAEDYPVLSKYDHRFQPLIRQVFSERP